MTEYAPKLLRANLTIGVVEEETVPREDGVPIPEKVKKLELEGIIEISIKVRRLRKWLTQHMM